MSYLCDYRFDKVKEIIAANPQVICCICANEPIQNLPLNMNEFITNKIAENVSQKTGVFLTAPILQGVITPFKPFALIGAHHRGFCGLISDCVRSLCASGVKKIFFITSSNLFTAYVNEGINKYKRKLPSDFSSEIICWQNVKIVKETTENQFENLLEFWRKESAVFMIANELKGIEIPNVLPEPPFSKDDFTKWLKRGMDPEKLKKLSPQFRFSSWTKFTPSKDSFFEKVCEEISLKILKSKL
ncbi:MAG: hypothetical protein LBH98_04830 [Chitinispirillales bacterium]|nr:hypothetical protein [Chitinispirillales bacterium]